MLRPNHVVLLLVLLVPHAAYSANIISATANTLVNEGSSTTVTGYVTGSGPTIGLSVNWGDGTANSTSTINPNTSEAWLSSDAVLNLTSTGANGLTRGQITGSASTVAELEFYQAANGFGVSLPAAISGTYGTGTYDPGANSSTASVQNGYWQLPGGQDGSFPCYVAKSALGRGLDIGETGPLPGGVAGVYDLQYHPSVGTEQPHVIAFVAPANGIYEIRNFGIRRPLANNAQGGRTTVRIFSALPNLAGDENYIGATLTAQAPSQDWVLDNNVYYLTLTAGQKIHFALHRGDFINAGDGWSTDDTELAFDITRVHQFSFNHTYTDDPAGTAPNETYARSITATDTGAPATLNLPQTVNNLAPTITSATVTASSTQPESVTISGIFADASPGDTFVVSINWGDANVSTIPVGAGGTTFNAQHIYVDSSGAQTGQTVNFPVQVTITDDDAGIVVSTSQATITYPTPVLAFVSGPTASPSSATVNQEVTFTGGVNVSGATITWDFKDGTALRTGQVVAHLFSAAGTYAVTATAAHTQSNQNLQRTVTVTVTAAASGGGGGGGGDETVNSSELDSDNDGFGDQIESATGSNPNSAASTPFGLPPPTVDETLNISKAQIKLNHSLSGADSIVASGTVAIDAGFVVVGTRVLINCGGVVKTFELDNKGKASDGTHSFKLAVKAKNGVVLAQQAKFQLKLTRGSYSSYLADEELLNTTAKNEPRKVFMEMVLGTTVYSREVSADYTSTAGRSGRFQ